jgi:transcriptional regulator with XRE-family HTH domain
MTEFLGDTKPLLEWIEELQRRRGWNRSEFSQAAGVDASVVSRWFVNGVRPRPQVLARMAERLGADAGELMRLAGYGEVSEIGDPHTADLIAKLRQVTLTSDRYHILDVLLEDLRRREP